jgi:hypothetical protein
VNAKPDGAPYRMVGVPDGLGAFDNGDGTFTVLMNHELGATSGAIRAHGAKGSFVSRWTIQKGSLRVLRGEDLIQSVALWDPAANGGAGGYAAPAKGVALARLCSADLPPAGVFFDAAGRTGYDGRLFMNGEENGAEGRAFAHTLDGVSYQLPHLGRFSWENSLVQPRTGRATVVVGTDDSTPGQVYVYIGEKRATGNPVERAGLVGGHLYGVKVAGVATEDVATGIPSGTAFSLVDLGDVSAKSGTTLDADSTAAGVTRFQRPEDGAWNPADPSQFAFATTASFTTRSRLWRLDFADAADPAKGGTIDMLLDGTEGQRMLDNLTFTDRGQIMLQEDPGSQPYVAKLDRYSVAADTLNEVAHFDDARFTPGAPAFITQDEESSGIIPAGDILGEGWFLADAQVHLPSSDPELVEGGQLFALHVPPGQTR